MNILRAQMHSTFGLGVNKKSRFIYVRLAALDTSEYVCTYVYVVLFTRRLRAFRLMNCQRETSEALRQYFSGKLVMFISKGYELS